MGLNLLQQILAIVLWLVHNIDYSYQAEALREILKINNNIAVFMLTCEEDEEYRVLANKLGAFDYLTKPITLDVTYYGSAVAGGKNKMGFSAVGVLKRSDFGFSAMVGPLGDDVTFMIESELVKQ